MKTQILRKFTFSDLRLAFKVRGNMHDTLVQFDTDKNQAFNEKEIKHALISILGEDQNQVTYAVKNVFRYDRDSDRMITYTQFTNFSVQQHFGEMAIQRLHKKGHYVNGAKRIMNLDEFQVTLNTCLSCINSQGTTAEYQWLFNQIDLDRDGYISYQDYFTFLREYFGSQSEAFLRQVQDSKNKPPAPEPKPQTPSLPELEMEMDSETARTKFARLIYSQFKITVMQNDRNKNLMLQRDQAEDLLSISLKLNYSEITPLLNSIMTGASASSIRYEEFMNRVLVAYMGSLGLQRHLHGEAISEGQFLEGMGRLCGFVSVKPAENVLRACFRGANRGKNLSQSEISQLMVSIFQNFRHDTRGLPSIRPTNQKYQAIDPIQYY